MFANDPPSVCHLVSTFPNEKSVRVERDVRITPGIQAKIVRRMLMRKSTPRPVFMKTATGGRNMAMR